MKLEMQENEISHALELFFHEGNYGVLFQSFLETYKCRGREEVNRKCFPKDNTCSEKVVVENIFLEWQNRRKTKIQDSSLASCLHNWQVLATVGHCYSQYYRRVTELLAD